jgi:hypothetical protein
MKSKKKSMSKKEGKKKNESDDQGYLLIRKDDIYR